METDSQQTTMGYELSGSKMLTFPLSRRGWLTHSFIHSFIQQVPTKPPRILPTVLHRHQGPTVTTKVSVLEGVSATPAHAAGLPWSP